MTVFIRISIVFFYQRIFATANSRLRYILWLLLTLQIVYLVVYSILPAFNCRPLHMAWHPLERHEYCNDWYYYHTQVALYSTSMAFDIILLVFPLYPTFKLQLPLRKRIGISVIFMLGAGYVFHPSNLILSTSIFPKKNLTISIVLASQPRTSSQSSSSRCVATRTSTRTVSPPTLPHTPNFHFPKRTSPLKRT